MKSFLSILLCLLLTGFNLDAYRAVMAEREAMADPVADEAAHGLIGGSFIQAWLACAYTPEHWDTEFAKMRALGMEYLIVETFLGDKPLYDTDPAADDMLSVVLRTAGKYGIKIIAGLTNGAGVYYDTTGAYVNRLTPWVDPFEAFHEQDLARATQVMNDILGKYGEAYGDTLYGWYFAHEFFNNALYGPAAWRSIGRHINGYVQAIESSSAPEMPLVFSPFYQIGLPYIRPGAYVRGLKLLFAEAKLRPFDVFMPQDGFGTVTGGPLPEDLVVPSVLAPWVEALGKAAAQAGVTFWINNEAFHGPDIATRLPAQVAMQAVKTDQYAETHFIFSWNHYYSATFYPEKAALEREFEELFGP